MLRVTVHMVREVEMADNTTYMHVPWNGEGRHEGCSLDVHHLVM